MAFRMRQQFRDDDDNLAGCQLSIFQMSDNIRSASSEDYHEVKQVLTGKREDTTVSVGR